jgi:hypothetical protein
MKRTLIKKGKGMKKEEKKLEVKEEVKAKPFTLIKCPRLISAKLSI